MEVDDDVIPAMEQQHKHEVGSCGGSDFHA
jgi:hypothetical protein